MPTDSSLLAKELKQVARLRGVQASLPILLKPAPVVAIAAGAVISRLVGQQPERNLVEERLLGRDYDTILLSAGPDAASQNQPSQNSSSKHVHRSETSGEPPTDPGSVGGARQK